MASRNPDAVANQGEFHAARPRDEPLTTSGVSIQYPYPNPFID